MPYTWDDKHIESKADKNTDTLGLGEIGGIGQLVYHIFRFQEYDHDVDEDGRCYAYGLCDPGKEPLFGRENALTGKDILVSLCNLAKKIDDFSEKKPYTELIMEWCLENAHPYSVDHIYAGLNDKAFDIRTDGFLIEKDSIFYLDDFMSDLGKLYNAARFYSALEGVCVADEDSAFNLYREGRHFEAPPFFEKYKHETPTVPDDILAPAKGDLIKEMQLSNEYLTVHQELYQADFTGDFAVEPYDYYEALRDRLLECIPDFRMRLKLNPKTNRLVFSADINSVFDIAWYTLARLLSEDPAPENKGEKEEREEGIMICCRHCGDFLIRRNNRQEYCDKPECQKARNAKNQREFRKRKAIEKAHEKAHKKDAYAVKDGTKERE